MNTFLALVAAYLLGSISFGLLAGKLLKGIDIRQFGSGNAGTTNILRTLGTGPAILVLLLDAGKGFTAVLLAQALTGNPPVMMLAGVTAVLGHNWPLFHRFKGGRGIATSIGILLGLAPLVILIATAIGVLIIAITRYVSLGSIVGASLIPIFMIIFGHDISYIIFGVALAVLAVWRHWENITRLLGGTENKLGAKVNVSAEEKKVEK